MKWIFDWIGQLFIKSYDKIDETKILRGCSEKDLKKIEGIIIGMEQKEIEEIKEEGLKGPVFVPLPICPINGWQLSCENCHWYNSETENCIIFDTFKSIKLYFDKKIKEED